MWSGTQVLSLKTPTKKHCISSAFTQRGNTQSGRCEGREDRARGKTVPHSSQWTRILLALRDPWTPVTSMLPAQSLDKCDGLKGLTPGGWGACLMPQMAWKEGGGKGGGDGALRGVGSPSLSLAADR